MKTQHTMNRIRHAGRGFVALLALVALCSCDKDVHKGEGGVSFSLTWEDPAERDTGIGEPLLWLYTDDGTLAGEYRYGSAAEFAAQRFPLAKGDYTAVIAANLTSPYSAENTGERNNLLIALGDASASPAHAHYATTAFSYEGTGTKRVEASLARVLSELAVTIEDAPAGTTLSTSVTDAAKGLLPAVKDSEGRFGSAHGDSAPVTLPEATTTDGTITVPVTRLMPTVSGNAHSHLRLVVTHADGTGMTCEVEAPVMKPSHTYSLTLRYSELQPLMLVTVHSINDWTEGWGVSGEIPDPDPITPITD